MSTANPLTDSERIDILADAIKQTAAASGQAAEAASQNSAAITLNADAINLNAEAIKGLAEAVKSLSDAVTLLADNDLEILSSLDALGHAQLDLASRIPPDDEVTAELASLRESLDQLQNRKAKILNAREWAGIALHAAEGLIRLTLGL